MASETVTSVSAPWSVQQPYLQYGFGQAQNLYNKGGPQYFPNSTVAPFSNTTNKALTGIENYGMNNPQLNQANQYFQGAIGGNYLNSNPYMDSMYSNAADSVTRQFNESVLPGVSAKYGMSGRTGSGLFQNSVQGAYEGLGDSLSGLAANLYGQNYANERTMQQEAAKFAPNLAQANFGAMSNVLDAGQIRDQQAQMNLNDQVKRFQFNQERPYENLNRYMGSIGGGYGSQSSSTQPMYETPMWQQVLGGGLLGGSLLGLF